MSGHRALALLLLLAAACTIEERPPAPRAAVTRAAPRAEGGPAIRQVTPVLVVDAVEPTLEVFTGRLGFRASTTVPLGDRLGFALVELGDVEVMIQSRRSVRDDSPATEPPPGSQASLFVEVTDLDAVVRALESLPVVLPRRTSFYGADEFGVREPGGHVLVFARFPTATP